MAEGKDIWQLWRSFFVFSILLTLLSSPKADVPHRCYLRCSGSLTASQRQLSLLSLLPLVICSPAFHIFCG